MVQASPNVTRHADELARKTARRRALESRPHQTLQDNVICARCRKKMPWQVLQKAILKEALVVNGQVYCIKCAKAVCVGMQALMLKMNAQEQADYYKTIRKKIDGEETRQQVKEILGDKWDEEVNYDDAAGMKKLLKNRDGSMETKTLFQRIFHKSSQLF